MTDRYQPKVEGFFNISKPYDWTSHDVVQVVRRLTGIKRVGHAGTLDPAATGVLVVAVGRATRLLDYAAGMDKSYCGDIVLGADTDTDDADGAVVRVSDPTHVRLSDITSALQGFLGAIEQVPPQYSAIKLQGRKAYDLARKGERANLTPRRVTIRGLAVAAWEPPTVSVIVRCSKGTYIRSLARDLGERLGVGGHLGALVRLSTGLFSLRDAVGIDDLRLASESGYLEQLILPPDTGVAHLPAIVLAQTHVGDMEAGRRWQASPAVPVSGSVRVYSEQGGFLGLAELSDGWWQPKMVMAEAQ